MQKILFVALISMGLFSACGNNNGSQISDNQENKEQKEEVVKLDSLSKEMESQTKEIDETVDELDGLLQDIDSN